MKEVVQAPSLTPDLGIYVEVLGPDGLAHHVGPFKSREHAEAWIAQNSPDRTPARAKRANKSA